MYYSVALTVTSHITRPAGWDWTGQDWMNPDCIYALDWQNAKSWF